MEQGGDKWLEWRMGGIGSSDAPAIMGASPYKTAYQLWKEKTGRETSESNSFIMQKGHEVEVIARTHYELLCGMDMPAVIVEHETLSFLRASLDGRNAEHEKFLEIKYQGEAAHNIALDESLPSWDRVPDKYKWQLIHQFLVTGDRECDFVSFNPDVKDKIAIVTLSPSLHLVRELVLGEFKFWGHVLSDVAPELSDRDYKTVSDTETIGLINLLKSEDLHGLTKDKTKIKEIEGEIIERMDHPRMEYQGLKIYQSNRQGKVVTTFKFPKDINNKLKEIIR